MSTGLLEPERELRVLLVDDDRVDRTAVRRALRSGGIRADVRDAQDVHAAIDALADEFDIVLLDYNLPGGDGLRVLREIRGQGNEVPVIVLTGQQDPRTAAELIQEGASDYLSKNDLTPDLLIRSVTNVLRLHHAVLHARQAEVRFRTVQETSPDAFLVLRSVRDERGEVVDFRIDYANPAAGRMSRMSPDEMVGSTVLTLNPDFGATGLLALYAEVVETGKPVETEVHYTRDSIDVWLRITAVKLEDGVAIGAGDISRRKRAEKEREQAIAARSRFYAVMSHELRTPINAILGYNDLVLAEIYGQLPNGAKESIERSQRATRHLLELVNDVLDLSKLEAGKVETTISTVVISELLDEMLATIRPLAESRGSDLIIDPDICKDPLQTDPRRVRQILLNLVSNAIKFGAGKPVRIACLRADDWIDLEVVDQGPGIEPEDIASIFDEFVQLSNTSGEGTGLGLSISKRLAEILGGELQVESRPGEGSTFRLRLPATEAAVATV